MNKVSIMINHVIRITVYESNVKFITKPNIYIYIIWFLTLEIIYCMKLVYLSICEMDRSELSRRHGHWRLVVL